MIALLDNDLAFMKIAIVFILRLVEETLLMIDRRGLQYAEETSAHIPLASFDFLRQRDFERGVKVSPLNR